MPSAPVNRQAVLRPYGGPPVGFAPKPRSGALIFLVASGGFATLVALPITALTAFGWGFSVGGLEFLVASLKTLASVAILPVAAAFLCSRANWVASATAWLAATGVLLCIVAWMYGLNSLNSFWHIMDTYGNSAVFIGAGVQRVRAERNRPAHRS